jgi:hypothetical protein
MLHHKTLAAALRRGGAFVGAHRIDLPGDLAAAVLPQLLEGWAKTAKAVEGVFADYQVATENLLRHLEAAAAAAATVSGVAGDPEAIADSRLMLILSLQAAKNSLAAAIGSGTSRVQEVLRRRITDYFEQECERVNQQTPSGAGWTNRALIAFSSVAEGAIIEGTAVAVKVLEDELGKLQKQLIEQVLDTQKSPIGAAFRRLVDSVQGKEDPPEVVEARAALAAWAASGLAAFQSATSRS